MALRSVRPFVVVVASITVLFSAVGATSSAAATRTPIGEAVASPVVKVSPSTRLIDRETVTVTTKRFDPYTRLATVQCRRGASGAGGCDLSTIVYVWSDKHGAVTLRRHVRRLITVGQTLIDCGGRRGCILRVGTVTKPKQAGSQTIFFNPKVPPMVPKANRRPVNAVITYKDGDCTMQYEFGTSNSTAFADVRAIRENIGDICLINSQVVAKRGPTILISQPSLFSCGANTTRRCSSPSYMSWRQSTIPYATGFGAHINVIEIRNRKPHNHSFSVSAF
jgi:hypothetical protein